MIVGTKICSECRYYVSVNVQFDKDGQPFWVCPHCGKVSKEHNWYEYVSHKEAIEIIEHRGRRGLFVENTGSKFVGIDNSTGDAWTEEFASITECLRWLAGEHKAAIEQNRWKDGYVTGDGPAEDVELCQHRCLSCGHTWYEDCNAEKNPGWCPGCGKELKRKVAWYKNDKE